MNEKIKKHVGDYCQSQGWQTSDADILEAILEAEKVWSGNEEECRHWIDYDKVVKINGMYIMFGWAKGAGDQGPRDVG